MLHCVMMHAARLDCGKRRLLKLVAACATCHHLSYNLVSETKCRPMMKDARSLKIRPDSPWRRVPRGGTTSKIELGRCAFGHCVSVSVHDDRSIRLFANVEIIIRSTSRVALNRVGDGATAADGETVFIRPSLLLVGPCAPRSHTTATQVA